MSRARPERLAPDRLVPDRLLIGLLAGLLAGLLGAGCRGGPPGRSSPPTADPTRTPSAATTTAAPSPRPSPTPTTPGTPTAAPSPRAVAPPRIGRPVPDDALAGLLATAEQRIRDPDAPPGRVVRWARAQQYLYRLLADRPALHEPVVRRVPAAVRPAVRNNLAATVQLRRLTDPREELPDWRIVAPPPAGELRAAYAEAADAFGLDWTYLAAIHLVETRMGRIRGTSTAGARGPMQFLPSTWEAYGSGDITDPHDAIRAAAHYLADHGAPGDMHRALYAYNNSDRYVEAIRHHAAVMRAAPQTYRAYHAWQVYYRLASGDVVLPVGWPDEPEVTVTPP